MPGILARVEPRGGRVPLDHHRDNLARNGAGLKVAVTIHGAKDLARGDLRGR
jgi:hypothetical protein